MIIIINEANKMMYKREGEGEGESVNESGVVCMVGLVVLEGPARRRRRVSWRASRTTPRSQWSGVG